MDQLTKLIRLRPGEGSRVALLALQYFCIVAVTIAGKSTRDTYFLARYDRSYLPLMFVVCAVVVALLASLYSKAVVRVPRALLTSMTYAAFVSVLLVMQTRVEGLVVPALYVWVEVVISLATLQFWIQAADTFDARQAKRLFSLIGAGGSLAAFAVGMSLKPYVKAFGSGSLLLLVCAGLAGSWLFGRMASKYELRQPRRARAAGAAQEKPKLDRYLIYMAIIVALSAAVTQVVDYQFKISAGRAIANEADLAAFFGRFYAATGVASLLMQLFFTTSILNRFGLRGGLYALPAFLGASAAGFLAMPSLITASLSKFSDQTFKFTLNNSSLELLWLPVSAERRRALKPLIGGAFKASAEALAGLLTFFVVKKFETPVLSLFTLAAVTVWLVLCFRITFLYVRALAQAIEKRDVDMTGLEIDAQDPSFTRTMTAELEQPDLLRRLFALELLEGLRLDPWAPALRRMLHEGAPEESNRVIELAQNDEAIVPDSLLVEMAAQPAGLSVAAITAAASRSLTACLPGLEKLLDHPNAETRARAAAAILRISAQPHPQARQVLRELALTGAGPAQAIAVDQLGDDPASLSSEELRAIARSGSVDGRIAASAAAARRLDTSVVPAIVSNLTDARTARAATAALAAFPRGTVSADLEAVLHAVPPSPYRPGVLRAYQDLPFDDAAERLKSTLPSLKPSETRVAALSLLALARRQSRPGATAQEIEASARRLARHAFRSVRMLTLLPDAPEAALLRDHYENQVRESVPGMLLMGSLDAPQSPVEQCIRTYESRDASRLPFVLEFIDTAFRGEHRAGIVPLLEQQSWSEKDAAGKRLYEDLPQDLHAELSYAAASHDHWESSIARHYLVKTGKPAPPGVVHLDIEMFSTLEKSILLKSVSLFKDIPAEKLSRIAAIAEERAVPAGAVILKAGDFGESMFVVASGSVRVHLEDRELTVFHRGDCVGEMSLLDGAPRSASATALEQTTLLEIDQQNFYEVMETYPEIMKEVVRLLTRRLREANDRIAAGK